MNEQQQVNCPYCDELISKNAKKCRHCGEILDPQLREIEMLKRDKNQNVIVSNNNNNNNNNISTGKKRFPWVAHLVLTILTGGLWGIVWILHWIFRDKNTYC
ncbi:zinc ribbon domain-containing protein [Edwardsiella tarda]|uniref:zinc ribbon domain-containing protein n=1 Tax=Edwardsiella tarda TaxID=636 RepID=UPI002670481C|nr:zinc ribbon domain-containing protein [Edwardsiella tarda]WKS80412.1 zinc ribbon domain-containing protein [Edwardsiella tarda]